MAGIFRTLLKSKIDEFVSAYSETAQALFYDDNGKALHDGEYGTYREAVTRDFIRYFVPERFGIGTGFIFNRKGDVSTQCDIVIYDKALTPLIEAGDRQRFFPVESVCAVGEVKSTLDKARLSEALRKLGQIKQLREDFDPDKIVIMKRSIKEQEHEYNPILVPYDHMNTFLVCKHLNLGKKYDFHSLPADVSDWYGADCPPHRRHNMVLSVDDGLLFYTATDRETDYGWAYPVACTERCENRFHVPIGNNYSHFQFFCTLLMQLLTEATIVFPDMALHFGEVEQYRICRETDRPKLKRKPRKVRAVTNAKRSINKSQRDPKGKNQDAQ